MRFNTLKEYQDDIRQRFIRDGRPPPSPRERYYSFAQINLEYGIKENVPTPVTTPVQNVSQEVRAHLNYLQNKLNDHLNKSKTRDRI